MTGSLLWRGMLAGLLAAVAAVLFAHTCGEPLVERAILFEEAAAWAAHETPEPEIYDRGTQAGLGLAIGTSLFGMGCGGIVALATAACLGRVRGWSSRGLAAGLSAAGFLVAALVPAFKYPPNPPAIGRAETIGPRTALYFAAIVAGLAALVLAVAVARRLLNRLGAWEASAVGIASFVAIVAGVQAAMPDFAGVPADFPASVLWRFRLASLGMQAVVWGGIGYGFGLLTTLWPVGTRDGARA